MFSFDDKVMTMDYFRELLTGTKKVFFNKLFLKIYKINLIKKSF